MNRLFLVACGLAAVSAVAGCSSKSNESDGGGGASGGLAGSQGGSSVGAGSGGAGSGGAGGGGAPVCAFSATYTILDWSGADTDDVMALLPPNSFHYTGETPTFEDGATRRSCAPPLPACNDPAQLDVGDVEAAIANADVQAAFAMKSTSFGDHSGLPSPTARELSFSSDSGNFINVGPDCPTPAGVCTPVPPGIKALVDLLRALKAQQRADPSCAGVN
jgi:hypothetical protein